MNHSILFLIYRHHNRTRLYMLCGSNTIYNNNTYLYTAFLRSNSKRALHVHIKQAIVKSIKYILRDRKIHSDRNEYLNTSNIM